jgi:hypothetical protein
LIIQQLSHVEYGLVIFQIFQNINFVAIPVGKYSPDLLLVPLLVIKDTLLDFFRGLRLTNASLQNILCFIKEDSCMSQTKVALFPKEQIERRAYELYLESGCVNGRDLENWQAAEEELRKEYESSDSPRKKNAAVTQQRRKIRARLPKSAAN